MKAKRSIYIMVSVLAAVSIVFGCALYLRSVHTIDGSIDYFLEFTANNTATNDQDNITTWSITYIIRHPGYEFSLISWQLIDENNLIIPVNGTEKSLTDFKNDILKNDTIYQLYFYDKDSSGTVTRGDELKVKAPEDGLYKIKAVIPVFGGKKIDYTCWISSYTHY